MKRTSASYILRKAGATGTQRPRVNHYPFCPSERVFNGSVATRAGAIVTSRRRPRIALDGGEIRSSLCFFVARPSAGRDYPRLTSQLPYYASRAFSSQTSQVEKHDAPGDDDKQGAGPVRTDSDDEHSTYSTVGYKGKRSDRPNHNSKITAAHIVKQRQRKVCQISSGATLEEAIKILASNNANTSMVYNERTPGGAKEVVGIFTAQDVIKTLSKQADKAEALQSLVKNAMTPMSRVIYCSPDDTLEKVQYIMVELQIRTLPVVKDGVIYGIITLGDVINHHYSSEEIGGKKAFIKGVAGRLGLPSGTQVASHVVKEGVKKSIKWKVGVAALPHPFKRRDGVAASLRLHGPKDYATDLDLSEDASFVLNLPWPHEHGDEATYVGIADGVGSWREHGVDPREYSHRLMQLCEQFIRSMAPKAPNLVTPMVRPLDVLSSAWETITKEKVVGSSTACIATLDMELNQLSFCNVGDSGIIIMRHIDSDVAGYMRDKTTPRPLRTNDFRIAFVSRQQLRSFNLPYQMGYTNTQPENCFDTPSDADNSSIPIMRGDVIIMGTDGLFDNVELDEICSIALAWEQKWFGSGAHSSGLRASDFPEESVQELAMTLCRRARELSLDQKRDSPFAILAKENDIMWGGGMPDDCTIFAMRVVKTT